MTNLERLSGKFLFPVQESALIGALLDRGLTYTDDYAVANKRAMELTMADMAMTLITSPSITEGGYQINHSNKGELRRLADGIYSRWNEDNPFDFSPKVRDATNKW